MRRRSDAHRKWMTEVLPLAAVALCACATPKSAQQCRSEFDSCLRLCSFNWKARVPACGPGCADRAEGCEDSVRAELAAAALCDGTCVPGTERCADGKCVPGTGLIEGPLTAPSGAVVAERADGGRHGPEVEMVSIDSATPEGANGGCREAVADGGLGAWLPPGSGEQEGRFWRPWSPEDEAVAVAVFAEHLGRLARSPISSKVCLSNTGAEGALAMDAARQPGTRNHARPLDLPCRIRRKSAEAGGWADDLFDERVCTERHPGRRAGTSFTIEAMRIDGDDARVVTSFYCGPLCGHGETLSLRRQDGKWEIVGHTRLWDI